MDKLYHNPFFIFFALLIGLFIFGFLVNLFYPAKSKKRILSSVPVDTLAVQIKDVNDAITRAKTAAQYSYAEELAKSVARNNPDVIGIGDDLEMWLDEIKLKRAGTGLNI
jgi:hypothetical protein